MLGTDKSPWEACRLVFLGRLKEIGRHEYVNPNKMKKYEAKSLGEGDPLFFHRSSFSESLAGQRTPAFSEKRNEGMKKQFRAPKGKMRTWLRKKEAMKSVNKTAAGTIWIRGDERIRLLGEK